MRCDWNLAKTQFGFVLDFFFDELQLEHGYDTIWKCFKIFSMRCDLILAKTHFRNVLENFRSDAIGIWLRQNMGLS